MLESFFKTKTIADIWVHLCDDDPMIQEYKQVLSGIPHEVGPHKYLAQVYNYGALVKFPDYDCYHDANDDHVFHTHGWDQVMYDEIMKHGGIGVAYGKTQNLPTAIMVGVGQVRALGYWFPPGFQHHSVDLFVRDLGEATKTLYYLPDVDIEHRHVVFGKALNDDNYKWVYGKEQQLIGMAAYSQWKEHGMARDIMILNNLKGR
jgi:hypothetical protein